MFGSSQSKAAKLAARTVEGRITRLESIKSRGSVRYALQIEGDERIYTHTMHVGNGGAHAPHQGTVLLLARLSDFVRIVFLETSAPQVKEIETIALAVGS